MLRRRWNTPKTSARSADEIERLARAGEAVAGALRAATAACKPGATTEQIDAIARERIRAAGAESLFRGYRQGASPPFPADACVSVNEAVVHGVPGARQLQPGDVVSIDIGLVLDGWCGDSATTAIVEGDSDNDAAPHSTPGPRTDTVPIAERVRLVQTTRLVLDLAADRMAAGRAWSDIALELEQRTVDAGFGYVVDYVGHGIGEKLHEPPKAPCYWTGYTGPDFELTEGMVLAVEPLLVAGAGVGRVGVTVAGDGWTVLAPPGSFACHEEYMIAVGKAGGRVLSGGGRPAIGAP